MLTEKQFVSYNHMELVDDFERKGYLEKHREWSMNTLLSILTARNYIGTSADFGRHPEYQCTCKQEFDERIKR